MVLTLKVLDAHCVITFVSWWPSCLKSRELYDPTKATPPLKYSPLQKRGDWAKLTFAKTSGTDTKDRGEHWPIADWHVPGNDPRYNCGTHFGSSFLLFTKVANRPPFKRCRGYSTSPGYLKEGKLGWS